MFKRSFKVIASVIAAAAAMTALSAAAKADVYYDPNGAVVYDTYNNGAYFAYEPVYNYANAVSVSYDMYGNRIVVCADGTTFIEKADDTFIFAPVTFGVNDYVVNYYDKASAERAVGFGITIPEAFRNFPYAEYSVISGSILQVRLTDALGNCAVIRKGAGKADISGDASAYLYQEKELVGTSPAVISGSVNGFFKGIEYKNGYSLSVVSNYGMTLSEAENILGGVA
ncbi:MAG: hypothetical protein IJ251_05015 [Oscillospiraceae bacterium]|nr:hypothetical protein [Oscillospiraceae bacterium]